ncbi:hypothetical protein G6514_009313 [Epicoccum nigrum]|nr:hypothetical protein G6514_009313 [Epicoccum nigrum]
MAAKNPQDKQIQSDLIAHIHEVEAFLNSRKRLDVALKAYAKKVSKMPDYIKTINNLAGGSEDSIEIPKDKMDKDLYEGYLKDIQKFRAVAEQRILEAEEAGKKQAAAGTNKQAAKGKRKQAATGKAVEAKVS